MLGKINGNYINSSLATRFKKINNLSLNFNGLNSLNDIKCDTFENSKSKKEISSLVLKKSDEIIGKINQIGSRACEIQRNGFFELDKSNYIIDSCSCNNFQNTKIDDREIIFSDIDDSNKALSEIRDNKVLKRTIFNPKTKMVSEIQVDVSDNNIGETYYFNSDKRLYLYKKETNFDIGKEQNKEYARFDGHSRLREFIYNRTLYNNGDEYSSECFDFNSGSFYKYRGGYKLEDGAIKTKERFNYEGNFIHFEENSVFNKDFSQSADKVIDFNKRIPYSFEENLSVSGNGKSSSDSFKYKDGDFVNI